MFRIHRDHDDHSVYAGRLGRFRRRIPSDDREGCFPDEGSRPFRCVCLFTAAGRDKGFAVQDGGIRLKHHSSAERKSDRSSRRLLVLPFIPWNERRRESWGGSVLNSHGAGDDVWFQTARCEEDPIVIEQLIPPVIQTDSGTAQSTHERKSLQLWLVRHGENRMGAHHGSLRHVL